MKFIILIILLIYFSLQKHLIIKIKGGNYELNQITKNNFVKSEEIMNILFYNDIFTLINVGKPKKELKFYFTFNDDKTILASKEFSKYRSISYKYNNITNESSDLFEFQENKDYKINDYHFNLSEIDSQNKCILGLKPSEKNNLNINLLYQLQKNGLIDKRILSFIYIENSETHFKKELLLIGIMPKEYNLNYYLLNSMNEIKWANLPKINNDNQKWEIKVDSFYTNFNLTKSKNAAKIEFVLEYNLIIAPDSFRNYLLENLINLLIDKEICKEDYFYNERTKSPYIYYECNQIENFQNKILYFENKELNETFEIKLEDLFFRYDRKYFFGIIFNGENKKEKTENNVWKMGKLFYEKYFFVFDDENKRIGYYKINKENDNPYIILVSFILFFIFIIALSFIGYFSRKKENNKKSQDKTQINNKKEKEKEKID